MKRIFVGFTSLVLFLSIASHVHASEGQTVLTNRIGTQATCWIGSVFMQDLYYHLLGTCRNITYPGGAEIVNYIVWATPQSGGAPVWVGDLGLGKVEYRTQNPFSSLFVTVERDRNVRTPSGPIIMQGSIEPFSMLEGKTRATSKPSEVAAPQESTDDPLSATPKPTAAPASGIARFLTGGIIAFLGLFAVIFIIFIVTRR